MKNKMESLIDGEINSSIHIEGSCPVFLEFLRKHMKGKRGRGYLLKLFIKLFPSLNFCFLKMHQLKLPLDLRNDAEIGYFYSNGIEHEKFYSEVLLKVIQKDTVFFDIGANIGYYSFLVSRFVKQVYAFEPNPQLSNRLSSAVKANQIENVDVFNLGVSDHTGKLNLFFSQSGHDLASFIKNDGNTESIQVNVVSIDDTFPQLNLMVPDVIKVDTEGYEVYVLKGYHQMRIHKPILFIEWISNDDAQQKLTDALGGWFEAEYSIFKIGYNNELIPWNNAEFKSYSNLLIIPKAHASLKELQPYIL